MRTEIDAARIEAARAGDTAAQDELVAACLPLVYNIVGRALGGHADVDDVVQETMLRVVNGLGDLRDPAGFRSWLVAITTNQIRTHWRGKRPETPGDQPAEVPDPSSDFVAVTIVRLGLEGQRREVAEATRWLDDGEREVLSLWWLEAAGELSRAEVAAALGLTPQHTAVRVQRIKERLDTARGVVRALAASPRCPELAALVAPWDGVPSALWRKRVARHARTCAACAAAGSALVPAEGLLVGLGLVPVTGALLGWWGGSTVLHTESVAAAAPASASTSAPAPAPAPVRAGHRAAGRRRAARSNAKGKRVAAGAAVLAVVAGAAVIGGSDLFGGDGPAVTEPRTQAASDAGRVMPLGDRTATLSASPSASSPSASPEEKKGAKDKPKPKATPTPSAKATSARPRPTRSAARPAPSPDRPRPTTAKATPRPAGGGSPAQQVTDLVNAERAKAGCSPLTGNAQLDQAAQAHSDDMAARGFFDHTNPDSKGPGDRVTAAGYRWTTYGENIAYGQQSAASVMDGWMKSPGHKANILNCSFKEIGVGVNHAPGGPRWTQVFGAR
ncbi:sigma-70 family RNA polymerase sigma factor [Streptomyces sp. AV19]|uniref:sigma-70 family RNA polymerase sigma factor n=1 Tax=Streptomyces sp. AV19 TaxID=2793068 RepID=UPI0018FE894B|nr:sigma-70 family RNA polymerase sigma factor [Streptomyces sp. AV19]MBH1933003.1 sigma-70 family RNA polymerase sigma factor [Streptomyces sp. AV19]MDG4531715.1 sigma-70 family RNA polymerase sigma factor [Streptomyces sp. AV19]